MNWSIDPITLIKALFIIAAIKFGPLLLVIGLIGLLLTRNTTTGTMRSYRRSFLFLFLVGVLCAPIFVGKRLEKSTTERETKEAKINNIKKLNFTVYRINYVPPDSKPLIYDLNLYGYLQVNWLRSQSHPSGEGYEAKVRQIKDTQRPGFPEACPSLDPNEVHLNFGEECQVIAETKQGYKLYQTKGYPVITTQVDGTLITIYFNYFKELQPENITDFTKMIDSLTPITNEELIQEIKKNGTLGS